MLHSSKAGLVGRLALRGSTPTVFVPHAWSFDAASGKAAQAALAWERVAAWQWTDLVLCVSAAEYHRGVSAGIRTTYQVTRNGVDITRVRTAAHAGPDRSELTRLIGVSPEVRLAVCLGRLTEQKGQDVLAAAWPMVPGGADRQLVFVGDGPDAEHLQAATAGDRSVTFTGGLPRSQALAWLAAADLVVVPSRWEGMALVPLEALALGSPVVASDVTGLREALCPEVGHVVPPDDPAALATAVSDWLTRAVGPDREAVAAAARARAEDHFSLASTVTAIDRALRDMQIRRGV
jgi:glycosyltransferase involved in cell wall biosynthesis